MGDAINYFLIKGATQTQKTQHRQQSIRQIRKNRCQKQRFRTSSRPS